MTADTNLTLDPRVFSSRYRLSHTRHASLFFGTRSQKEENKIRSETMSMLQKKKVSLSLS
jgi:hypothetical protein